MEQMNPHPIPSLMPGTRRVTPAAISFRKSELWSRVWSTDGVPHGCGPENDKAQHQEWTNYRNPYKSYPYDDACDSDTL